MNFTTGANLPASTSPKLGIAEVPLHSTFFLACAHLSAVVSMETEESEDIGPWASSLPPPDPSPYDFDFGQVDGLGWEDLVPFNESEGIPGKSEALTDFHIYLLNLQLLWDNYIPAINMRALAEMNIHLSTSSPVMPQMGK